MSEPDTAEPAYCPRCFQVVERTKPFCPHCGQFIHANIGGDSSNWDTRPPAIPAASAAGPQQSQRFELPDDQFMSGKDEDRDREQRRQVEGAEADGETAPSPETDSESA